VSGFIGILILAASGAVTGGELTVVLQPDEVIPTNTPAFRDYALKTVIQQANFVAGVWNLGIHLPIETNHITRFVSRPRLNGVSAGINVDRRYGFGVGNGTFSLFRDEDFYIRPYVQSDEKMDKLAGMTNLLTVESALVLARTRLHQLGLDDGGLDLGDPIMVRQWKYDSNDVIYLLPYYEVRWQATNRFLTVNMGISGVTSNIVEFDHNISSEALIGTDGDRLRVPTPTNYLEMLGLPTNVSFLPHNHERREQLRRALETNPVGLK
jgi:hypothetical protein